MHYSEAFTTYCTLNLFILIQSQYRNHHVQEFKYAIQRKISRKRFFGVSRTLKCADFILTRINEHRTTIDLRDNHDVSLR